MKVGCQLLLETQQWARGLRSGLRYQSRNLPAADKLPVVSYIFETCYNLIAWLFHSRIVLRLSSSLAIWLFKGFEELGNFTAGDGVPWTLSHCLFANMGGFGLWSHSVRWIGRKNNVASQSTENESSPQQPITDWFTAQKPPEIKKSVVSIDTVTDKQKSSDTQIRGSTGCDNPYHLQAPEILILRKKRGASCSFLTPV